jgi:hypothetical protein
MTSNEAFALTLFGDVLIAAIAMFAAKECSGDLSFAATVAIAIALIFSPGVVVGHGAMLFPAVPAIVFQPKSAGINAIPILIVFAVSFVIAFWLRRRRRLKESSRSSGSPTSQ